MTNDIQLAWSLVDKFHAGQMYGKEPYQVHLEAVQQSVAAASADERLEIVAILHDIVEDTMCTLSLLNELFEDNIVDAVKALTHSEDETKEDYLKRVKANDMACTVKIHDSLCNLRASVIRGDAKRIKKYTDQIAYLAAGSI